MGYHSTLTRTRDAGSFSLLAVGDTPTLYGSPDDSDGGAIYNDDTLRDDHITITITANDAGFDGGGIYDGGGVVDVPADPATLTDSTVFGNEPDNCGPANSVMGCFF